MGRFFGRSRERDWDEDPIVSSEQRVRNAVTNLRQRLHEDPDFKESFDDILREAWKREAQERQKESKTHSEAYGDEDSDPVKPSNQLHEIRGTAFFALISVLEALSAPPREVVVGWEGQTEETGDVVQIVDEIRGIIGEATLMAYSQAQLEPPVLLRQGAIGFHYEGFGTIVHLEKYLADQTGSEDS